MTLSRGDRLNLDYAGGGGYGPPAERDAAALAADLRDGFVSRDAAREIYRATERHAHEPLSGWHRIGGTFTDFVLVDERDRRIHLAKRLTTHEDYLDAIFKGLDELVESAGIGMRDIAGVVHGTTLVTNTVIERKGAKTALLTTEGARDIVEIGSELRYDIYDLGIQRPPQLVLAICATRYPNAWRPTARCCGRSISTGCRVWSRNCEAQRSVGGSLPAALLCEP